MLGTTALNGPIQDNLNGNISRLSSDKRALEEQVQGLRAEVTAADEFAVSAAGDLVGGRLTDRRVLLVTTPETPSDLVERLTPVLREAGATVSGTLNLLPALSDPEQAQLLEDLVAEVVPAGVDLPDGEPVERAAAELAAALVRPVEGEAVEPSEAQAVVSAFEEADLVQYSSEAETLRPATLAVVLTGPAVVRPDAAQAAQQQTVLALAAALDDGSDGAVLAGPSTSAAEGGTVRVLRDDSGVAGEVSSVDNADRGTGLVAVALALAEQLAGRSGQYGAGAGASAPLPTLTGS